jgi:hypothetical protein
MANVEFTMVGQASRSGRSSIHFHMVGNMKSSYAYGCSVHEGYNRAFALHGVSGVRLQENVVMNVAGHNFFLADGAESDNFLDQNLVMSPKKAWSLLNTDMTPAAFWI